MQKSIDISVILRYIICEKIEFWCGKFCGLNNFHKIWYTLPPPHILSIGVIPMKIYFAKSESTGIGDRCSGQLLLMFLTGVLLGGVLVRYFGLGSSVFSGIVDKSQLKSFFGVDFFTAVVAEAKFLLLLYLLSFQSWGAMLVPPVFGIEGICYGMTVCSLMIALGGKGAVVAFLLMIFRLVLILPYGFLLGVWAVERSLSFPENRGRPMAILVMTCAVMLLSAFLESSLARWLGGMYYLKFGV